MEQRKERKNVQLSKKMAEYVEEQCQELGVSQSGFINICIKQYKDQQLMMNELSKFQSYMEKMEQIVEKNKG